MAFSCSFNSATTRRSVRAAPRPARRSLCVNAKLRSPSEPHIQLGTAKLPNNVDTGRFVENLYQWGATLTQSGANFPFILPIKADKYDNSGFKISLLKKMPEGYFDSAGEIQATVEDVSSGKVVMVRFFEGPAALVDRRTPPPADSQERLQGVLQSCPDVETIMSTMPNALRNAVQRSR